MAAPAPPAQSTDVMESFNRDFAGFTITEFQSGTKFAKRPDNGGSLGRKLNVLTNCYQIKFPPQMDIHHYGSRRPEDLMWLSLLLRFLVPEEIWRALGEQQAQLQAILAAAGYDGRKSVFVPVRLFPWGTGSQTFVVTLPPHNTDAPNARPREFNVKISHANTLNTSVINQWLSRTPQGQQHGDLVSTVIQGMDVMVRHDEFLRPGVITGGQGRKFFAGNSGQGIGGGVDVLSGFFQSIRPTANGLVVNLDTAYSPFIRAGSLLDVCFAIVGRGGNHPQAAQGASGPFNHREIKQLNLVLKGARVRVTHRTNTKEFIIAGFGDSANRHTFQRDQSGARRPAQPSVVAVAAAAAAGQASLVRGAAPQESVTVASYFKEKYNKRLEHPDLQVVEVRGREFFPLECLELLPGTGVPPTRLSSDQASAMIKVAARKPDERKQLIDQQRKKIAYETNHRVQSWELNTSPSMMQVEARVLPPPRVQYSTQGKMKTPRVASGQWNLVDTKFITPNKPLKHWAVVAFADERILPLGHIQRFMEVLIGQMKQRGMVVPNERPIIKRGNMANRFPSIQDACRDVVVNDKNPRKEPPQLLIFILSDHKTYDDVKRDAMMSLPAPVPSQALLLKNILKDRGVDQYCGNVSMKINVKLHGSNWKIDPADLPKVSEKTVIFGADVTHPPAPRGSEAIAPSIACDSGTSKYSSQIRTQEGRQEPIAELADMITILLRGWIANKKGQKPDNIVFYRDGVSEGQYSIVVDVEIRAIKKAARDIDAKWNPKLTYIARSSSSFESVVDKGVTHPYLWDFYLQAHAGLVGTCRPTHYIALLDEAGFTSDTIQKLTNSLCYSFERATRSVSLVPPCYYADICCTKARSYAYLDDGASTVSGQSDTSTRAIQDKLERAGGVPGLWFL
ncbi:argonaute [Pseudohyphozyma bogoriensis]|nr:argonaute [Pseudohyphozyma bogoriensis]